MSRRNISKPIVMFFSTIIISFHSFSQPALSYKPVITSLNSPVDIVNANDGSNRLFVVLKMGIIKVYDQSLKYAGDFLTVKGISTEGERGLLSLVFHPDYKINGVFFVYYTNTQGNIEIAKYKVSANPDAADPATKSIIITIPHPGESNHNGGKLNFGADGYLYFATGDGGGGGDPPNNAQNGKSLLGKMIRINVNDSTAPLKYSIPADNPYINDTTIADEIWALGLRNPWRWSFDRLTQDLWIADVGQAKWEEINFVKATESKGANFGWRCYEGKHIYKATGCQPIDKYIVPIFEYPHNNATGGFSVTGGFVYRGSEYPSLNGYYIFADYVSRNQWMITDSSNTWVAIKQTGAFPPNISSFGESEDGTLYASSLSAGVVYKIEAVTDVKVQFLNFSGVEKNDITELTWTATEENLLQYEVESSTDSVNFEKKRVIPATNHASENAYTVNDTIQGIPKIFYRLRIINNDGKWDYSKTITVVNNSSNDVKFELITFSGIVRNNIAELTWSATEQNLLQYELESSSDSVNFERKGVLTATNHTTENTYIFLDTIGGIQKIFYRLHIVDSNGNGDYSKTITVINASTPDVKFQLVYFNGLVRNNIAELTWSAAEQNLKQYEVESSWDSVDFERKGITVATNKPTDNDYNFDENIRGIQKVFYRLRVVNNNGTWDYSKTITLLNNSSGKNFIYPSVIINKVITCFIPDSYDYLEVFGVNGSLVLKKDIKGITGRIDVPVLHLAKGIYMVKISTNSNNIMQKIIIN